MEDADMMEKLEEELNEVDSDKTGEEEAQEEEE